MAGDRMAPETEGAAEQPADSRSVQQLINTGYAGHVRGSDGSAEIDVHPPRSAEEAVKWKWQNSPEPDEYRH